MTGRSQPGVSDDGLRDALRGAGLRITSQRLVLFRALRELDRHATADEIATVAHDRLPGLSLPTVYATLDLLHRLGLVRRVAGTGAATLYDPRTEPHEHLVCRSCGAVVDVAADVDLDELLAAARRLGLGVDSSEVVLRGLCADCRAAENG